MGPVGTQSSDRFIMLRWLMGNLNVGQDLRGGVELSCQVCVQGVLGVGVRGQTWEWSLGGGQGSLSSGWLS